ncbi:SGNH/GDSL hydrolase family protein [Azohydromonas caseinilytica]|uniref:SGNH hydrolase-type esterase domain-containing protein n=1 Tax=Azohydromonas caseinilytica TaxID=2728836 RepID=A0A848FAK9_9BURK|nr:SGNH/GDSL hydrolase family protein [Azohydromonas caseinilytica]NML16574.1 hypothetical protein [Azohydromonas caseinilytica]
MLLVVEIALQVRAQIKTGQSVYTLMTGQGARAIDPVTGLRLLRPQAVIKGSGMELATNSWGLRNREVAPTPKPGDTRLALMGASSIQGTHAPTNDDTAASVLERQLQAQQRRIEVVNAGVADLTVPEQLTMLTKRLIPAGVHLVYWYPGANDITCRRPQKNAAQWRIAVPGLPQWLLTQSLIVKNASFLKSKTAASDASNGTPTLNAELLERILGDGIRAAQAAGVDMRLVTIATRYAPSQTPQERESYAASALHFRPCFNADQMIAHVQKMNSIIREQARLHGVPVVEAAPAMTGEAGLFGDASHFSVPGEKRFAELLLADFQAHPMVAEH